MAQIETDKKVLSFHRLRSKIVAEQKEKSGNVLFIRLPRLVATIQTRKFEIDSIQFCIGVLVLFCFIFVQLFRPYGLYRMVLSICYHCFVIIFINVTSQIFN